MKKSLIVLSALAATFMVSCTTVRKTAATEDVKAGICQIPTVADLEMRPKASKAAEWNCPLFGFGRRALEARKQSLVAEIVKESQADILLELQVTTTRRLLGRSTLVVTGYPAVFKNFRRATPEDLELLKQNASPRKTGIYNVSQPWYKKVISKFKK